MNTDTIEAALRRKPSDERVYEEPLAALVAGERMRPVTRSRARIGVLPALAAIAIVLVVAVGAAVVGLSRGPAVQPGGSPALSGLIGCMGTRLGFQSAVLASGPGSAETSDTAASAALRVLLADQNSYLPKSGWIVASQTADAVVFVGQDPSTQAWSEVVARRGQRPDGAVSVDGWWAAGYGGCSFMVVPPDGYSNATWVLDPATPYVAGATELHLLVEELSCHGFDTAEGRILADVSYAAATVTITAFTRVSAGPQTCPGTPPTPYVMHLSEPVGARSLLDGGPYPAEVRARDGVPSSTPTPGLEATKEPEPSASLDCQAVPADMTLPPTCTA
jgi:hypothetical protein